MTREEIWAAILEERDRQHAALSGPHLWGWGDCSGDGVATEVKSVVLAEECGEVARAVLDRKPDDLRTELIQVAAVAVAWLESLNSDKVFTAS